MSKLDIIQLVVTLWHLYCVLKTLWRLIEPLVMK